MSRWSGAGGSSSSKTPQRRSNAFWATDPASKPAPIPIGAKRNFIPAEVPRSVRGKRMAVSATPARRRLRRADCASLGISRRGRGRGFAYFDPGGERIEDEETLARIRELAIPPAWREVWICPDPMGHIQATGLDGAGRKQYLYHERWQLRAAERKFEAMRDFALALPRLRKAVG